MKYIEEAAVIELLYKLNHLIQATVDKQNELVDFYKSIIDLLNEKSKQLRLLAEMPAISDTAEPKAEVIKYLTEIDSKISAIATACDVGGLAHIGTSNPHNFRLQILRIGTKIEEDINAVSQKHKQLKDVLLELTHLLSEYNQTATLINNISIIMSEEARNMRTKLQRKCEELVDKIDQIRARVDSLPSTAASQSTKQMSVPNWYMSLTLCANILKKVQTGSITTQDVHHEVTHLLNKALTEVQAIDDYKRRADLSVSSAIQSALGIWGVTNPETELCLRKIQQAQQAWTSFNTTPSLGRLAFIRAPLLQPEMLRREPTAPPRL